MYIPCPGAILGASTGPIRQGTFFLKFLTELYVSLQGAFYVGEGSNEFALVRDYLVYPHCGLAQLKLAPPAPQRCTSRTCVISICAWWTRR